MFWRSFFERPGARRAASAVCTKRLAVSVAWRADDAYGWMSYE